MSVMEIVYRAAVSSELMEPKQVNVGVWHNRKYYAGMPMDGFKTCEGTAPFMPGVLTVTTWPDHRSICDAECPTCKREFVVCVTERRRNDIWRGTIVPVNKEKS